MISPLADAVITIAGFAGNIAAQGGGAPARAKFITTVGCDTLAV